MPRGPRAVRASETRSWFEKGAKLARGPLLLLFYPQLIANERLTHAESVNFGLCFDNPRVGEAGCDNLSV